MPILMDGNTYKFSEEEKALIKDKIDNDARLAATTYDYDRKENVYNKYQHTAGLPNDQEFAEFLYFCERRKLDPVVRDVYFQKRQGKATYLTSIDKLRVIAEETGNYAPGPAPIFRDANGQIVHAHTIPCYVECFAKKRTADGTWHTFSDLAYYHEYVQLTKSKKPNKMWEEKFMFMLEKCGDARVLRKGWPQVLGGLYTPDEMGQASNGKPDAPADEGTSDAGKEVADLKTGAANKGHGNEGMAANRCADCGANYSGNATHECPIVKCELCLTKYARGEQHVCKRKPEVRTYEVKKGKKVKIMSSIAGTVVKVYDQDKDGKPLATSRGSKYVKLTIAGLGKDATVNPHELFYCYDSDLFDALRISEGEWCTFTFETKMGAPGAVGDKKKLLWQTIDDVIVIGKTQFQGGKPVPPEDDESSTADAPETKVDEAVPKEQGSTDNDPTKDLFIGDRDIPKTDEPSGVVGVFDEDKGPY